MADTIRKITIHAREVKKDKQSFIACTAEIGGRWYKIKFVKGCAKAPQLKGLYELTIDFDNCSIERGRKYVTNDGREGRDRDTIWVKEITEIRKYTDEEMKEMNRNAMFALFDVPDEPMPF